MNSFLDFERVRTRVRVTTKTDVETVADGSGRVISIRARPAKAVVDTATTHDVDYAAMFRWMKERRRARKDSPHGQAD